MSRCQRKAASDFWRSGIREPFRRLIVEAQPRTPIAALNHGRFIVTGGALR